MIVSSPREMGAAIRSARTDLGWTQAELATRVGVTRQWIIATEAGRSARAPWLTVLRTCSALGLSTHLTSRDETTDTSKQPEDEANLDQIIAAHTHSPEVRPPLGPAPRSDPHDR